jgi:hypothetical protein
MPTVPAEPGVLPPLPVIREPPEPAPAVAEQAAVKTAHSKAGPDCDLGWKIMEILHWYASMAA